LTFANVPKNPDPEKYNLVGYRVLRSVEDGPNDGYIHGWWANEWMHIPKGDRDSKIKLYPELNHLDQKDERLISFLRNNILIQPPCKHSHNGKIVNPTLQKSLTRQNLAGQFHQPAYVERLLGLKKNKSLTKRRRPNNKTLSNGKIAKKEIPLRQASEKSRHKSWCIQMTYYNLMLKHNKRGKGVIKPEGFFIEAGAGDGEIISNSLYFELIYKWTGLLVEPNPDFHEALISKHRNAWILPHCLSTKTTPVIVEFFADLLTGGIIHEDTGEKISNVKSDGQMRRQIRVQCFPLYSVLKAIGILNVDYFSLDIEGPEFQVLKTVPWDLVNINVLGIETEHAGKVFEGSEDDISNYLDSVGYNKTKKVGHDLFFRKA